MIIAAKKNTDPAVIHAIAEEQVKQYPEESWVHSPESYKTLLGEGLTTLDMAVDDKDVFQRTPDPAEKLAAAKKAKADAIDGKTDALIEAGFSYEGQVFSLSRQAQQNLAGLLTAIAAGFPVTWPKTWNTLDDSGTHTVQDAAEFQLFYGTAMATVEAHLNSGTALKDQVRAAKTVEEVSAIEDNR